MKGLDGAFVVERINSDQSYLLLMAYSQLYSVLESSYFNLSHLCLKNLTSSYLKSSFLLENLTQY